MFFQKAEPNDLEFPYNAISPTTGALTYYTEEELWNEIDRILAEDTQRKFSIGQQCYFNLISGCANPAYFLDSAIAMTLEEYVLIKKFNIPVAQDIDSADYARLVTYSSIDDEYNAIINMKKKDV
ncbi:MAG: hypothetical protein CMC15_16300 [Flavobacteriaceae bacterium]|nr:hypothetical protein [Flavobacteriaceae bacterium]